ncbi:hypothetical protein [Thermopirellula anaerolimosa]
MSSLTPQPNRPWFNVDPQRVDADYLAFLAERVPKDLVEQLHGDGQPEIDLDRIPPASLVEPLSSGVFPRDEKERRELEQLLWHMVFYYLIDEEKGTIVDPYKLVYAMSLYLHCYILGGKDPPPDVYLDALRLLVTACAKLDFQTRLHVCRFLGSRITMLPPDPWDAVGAVSGLVWAIAVVLGSLVEDLAVFAEAAAREEAIEQKWHPDEFARPETPKRKDRLLRELYGPSGRVRQAADRLLTALGGPRNGDTGTRDTPS